MPEWIELVLVLLAAGALLYVLVKSRAMAELKTEMEVMRGKVARLEKDLKEFETKYEKAEEKYRKSEEELDKMTRRYLVAVGELEDERKRKK